jgi:hypothetical protein
MRHLLKYPSWWNSNWKPEEVSDELVELWRKETVYCDESNKELFTKMRQKYADMLSLAKELYGKDSLQVKYITKNSPSFSIPYDFRISVEERVKKAQEERLKKEQAVTAEKEKNQLTTEAIIWLSARGKTLGIDYTLENAILIADDIAYQEEIIRMKRSLNGNTMEFDGQNCDGPCSGWDGESNRCSCGNRRVCWTQGYSHSFKSPEVRAEAH